MRLKFDEGIKEITVGDLHYYDEAEETYLQDDDAENITEVIIPDSVTRIGNLAFLNCKSLESINIPDSVTFIGQAAFWGCKSLKSIIIPNSVTEIGKDAFDGCNNLTVKCNKGSCAEKFAIKNNIPCEYANKEKRYTIER